MQLLETQIPRCTLMAISHQSTNQLTPICSCAKPTTFSNPCTTYCPLTSFPITPQTTPPVTPSHSPSTYSLPQMILTPSQHSCIGTNRTHCVLRTGTAQPSIRTTTSIHYNTRTTYFRTNSLGHHHQHFLANRLQLWPRHLNDGTKSLVRNTAPPKNTTHAHRPNTSSHLPRILVFPNHTISKTVDSALLATPCIYSTISYIHVPYRPECATPNQPVTCRLCVDNKLPKVARALANGKQASALWSCPTKYALCSSIYYCVSLRISVCLVLHCFFLVFVRCMLAVVLEFERYAFSACQKFGVLTY